MVMEKTSLEFQKALLALDNVVMWDDEDVVAMTENYRSFTELLRKGILLLDENNDPIDVDKAMTCDSIATVSGAVLGTSTCTTFVESSAGVAEGARTGLSSLVTSICFLLCLFLSPLASIVPSCATAPALIFVGVLMVKSFAKVDTTDIRSAVPAFLALIMMPLTYSIANGIGIAAIAYVIITLFTGKYTKKDIMVTVIALLFLAKFIFVTM